MTCEYKAFHSDLTNSEKQPDCSDYFEEEKKVVKAYKGFNRDMTCRGFQFEEGKIYKEDGVPRFKHHGFHFCLYLEDVQKFVPERAKIVEVYALGEIEGNGMEYATNEIYIGKEIK